ncbi:MAG: hypothetical protein ACW99Q_15745 [Candidatus Kariarchaeaceae archaeon]|jgi:hypothetical protein
MARIKHTAPRQTRQKGQRSIDLPFYIQRIIPPWTQPKWLGGEIWRDVVARQPFAVICRDTLVSNILALDWKIEAKDSTKRDEHSEEIKYYTEFFEDTGDYDYTDIIEWIGKDALDLPFGSGTEIGREGDKPDGKVLWIELLDGATLFPVAWNDNWPVGQMVKEAGVKTVFFPWYAIDRVYMSPRTEIQRKGWGMAPPEKIFLALSLLDRGDYYYANLLLDTPEAGILDLGDMAKDSAEEWVEAWGKMLTGIDPFKIPVLYEHTTKAEWIGFTRNPTELLFDSTIMKYAAMVAAGYGMSLSDVGIQVTASGGETLAGSIRQERKTRRTGLARLKKKFKLFFDRMLPEYLEFKFIDQDEELSVAKGRALLTESTAWSQLIDKRIFSPLEARQQIIADGFTTVSFPEDVPDESEFPAIVTAPTPERPGQTGKPIAPSQGGHGEVKSRADLLELALEDDEEFKQAFNEIEVRFDDLSENDQDLALTGLQNYLDNYARITNSLDTKLKIHDNITEGV